MCQCDCGNKKVVRGDSLRNGTIKSCGCLQRQSCKNINKYYPGAKFGYLELLKETDKTKYRTKLWECKCWACGQNVLISTHELYQGKKSCCISINSIGEQTIASLLISNNISFKREYTNHNCRYPDTNALARFDFYIPENNYIIEYDGIQHFNVGNGAYDNPEKFQITQKHDNFKNNWCNKEKIPLIRIPYWHLDDLKIEDLKLETTEYLV